MNWWTGLEGICQADVPLAEHTWYGLGGPARWLLTPRDEDELATILTRCAEYAVPWRVLGRGANVLVRDQGFNGAVLKLSGAAWDSIAFEDPRVHAGGGVDFPRLVRQTIEHGLAGLENMAGIPGTVGGAIRMNAGGKYGCMAQFVEQVRVMGPAGTARTRSNADLDFAYRSCRLDGDIVLAATFQLAPADPVVAMQRFREIWNEKYGAQPPVAAKSAGCIFKNPPGHAAGQLLDQAGLKGLRSGGAEISPRHANFILAHAGATAQDVLALITLAQQRVRSATGIALELEVEIW